MRVQNAAEAVVFVVDAVDDAVRGRDCTLREVNPSCRWPHGGREMSRLRRDRWHLVA